MQTKAKIKSIKFEWNIVVYKINSKNAALNGAISDFNKKNVLALSIFLLTTNILFK